MALHELNGGLRKCYSLRGEEGEHLSSPGLFETIHFNRVLAVRGLTKGGQVPPCFPFKIV